MTLLLPPGVDEVADVAVTNMHAGLKVHRPGEEVTVCGVPMWAMVRPMPAAGHVARLSPHWCESCWPRENPWVRMLAAAYPSRFRTAQMQNRDRSAYVNRSRSLDARRSDVKERR